MFASEKLAELAAQKRVLLVESELNRQILAVHWARAGEPFRQGRAALSTFSGLRRYWIYLAPLAGFFLVRGRSSRGGRLARWLAIWRIGRQAWRFWGIWKSFSKKT